MLIIYIRKRINIFCMIICEEGFYVYIGMSYENFNLLFLFYLFWRVYEIV